MNRKALTLALAVPLFSLLFLAVNGCGRPPQIGADKETFRAVDALYTAVGLRDRALVDQCRTRLDNLLREGKLPESASRSLDSIVTEAREGKWEAAQDRLARFMEGQRQRR